MTSKLEARIRELPDNRQDEFRVFVDTGEASTDFLNWLDNDASGQAAVEVAFEAQIAGFENMAAEIHKTYPMPEKKNPVPLRFVREGNQFGFYWNDQPLIMANWQGWLVVGAIILLIL